MRGNRASEGWYQSVELELDRSMCSPQIENVIKKGKEELNESDKVSSGIWVPMRPRAGGRMKECVSHDAGKKSMV